MQFIGIHIGHDCNLTYTDNLSVRYVKLERNFQVKHYLNQILSDNIEVYDYLTDFLKDCEKILKIKISSVDAICYNINTAFYSPEHEVLLKEPCVQIDNNKSQFWNQFNCPVYNINHHYAHALSCWPLVNIKDSKYHFVLDGEGDNRVNCTVFRDNKILNFITAEESIGLSGQLAFLGMEYGIKGHFLDIAGKLMALQAMHTLSDNDVGEILHQYQSLDYRDLDKFVKEVNLKLTASAEGFAKFQEQKLNLAHMLHVFGKQKLPDFFASFLENKNSIFTYSGGTAQNTIVNTALKSHFKNIVIPPHCPDDGISLGCVEFLREKYNQPFFKTDNFPFWQSDQAPLTVPSDRTIDKAAEMLAKGKIIGWYQGNGEIGPRALGNRSILMDPSLKNGKNIINKRVKRRESYRPFGASILKEYTDKIFDCNFESPYMLYLSQCLDKDRFNSIVHLDNTCRIQTVNQEVQFEPFYNLIDKFRQKTGIPLLLNTSLNVDGKPIAAYTSGAVEVYNTTDIDALVVGDDVLVK